MDFFLFGHAGFYCIRIVTGPLARALFPIAGVCQGAWSGTDQLDAGLLSRLLFQAMTPALVQADALAIHFQDIDVMGQAVQQGAGEPFRAEGLRPFIERQVAGFFCAWRPQPNSPLGTNWATSEIHLEPSKYPEIHRRQLYAFGLTNDFSFSAHACVLFEHCV